MCLTLFTNAFPVLEIQNSQNLPSLVNTLALLDNCHSHVIIDKALQSAILVLENDVISRRCNDIQKQMDILEDENETLRNEIRTLRSEAEKLNGKLDETSSMLTVVAKGKEKLEDDLCSVFQLHNMICERKTEKDLQTDNNAIPENVVSQSATLAEVSEALKDEKEKEQEQSEIPSVKVCYTLCHFVIVNDFGSFLKARFLDVINPMILALRLPGITISCLGFVFYLTCIYMISYLGYTTG